jgi:hypothetical protein
MQVQLRDSHRFTLHTKPTQLQEQALRLSVSSLACPVGPNPFHGFADSDQTFASFINKNVGLDDGSATFAVTPAIINADVPGVGSFQVAALGIHIPADGGCQSQPSKYASAQCRDLSSASIYLLVYCKSASPIGHCRYR